MVSEIISKYQLLLTHIPELIDVSGYRNDYLSKKLGMKAATFSAKKLRGNWTVEEVDKLLSIIENEDVQDYMLLELMRQTKDDEVLSVKDFRKEIATWK